MRNTDSRLIIFAKAPVPGLVKTRLASDIGEARAAQIHRQLVLHTLETAAQCISRPIELWCAPGADHEFFQDCRQHYPLSLHTQQGNDLGERMSNAFIASLARGRDAVLIGTDCPLLDDEHLSLAFDSLEQGLDAVITPADDGGYVLLGLSVFSPRLFTGIDWGAPSVYRDTIERLEQLQWSWRGHGQLWDIDTAADFERLLALEGQALPARLRKLIGKLGRIY